MRSEDLFQRIVDNQNELWQALIISNWLGVTGRLIEMGLGVLLALVLTRLNELIRVRREMR